MLLIHLLMASSMLGAPQEEVFIGRPKLTATQPLHDLGVRYIERFPKLPRFNVQYTYFEYSGYQMGQPLSATGGVVDRVGGPLRFRASIMNYGSQPATGRGEWSINGLAAGDCPVVLAPGEQTFVELRATVQPERQIIALKLLPDHADDLDGNNRLAVASNALRIRIHIESAVYDRWRLFPNMSGAMGFDSWIQGHFSALNKMIADAGSDEQVCVDGIVTEKGRLSDGGTHAPDNWDWDGSWGFSAGEWMSSDSDSWKGGYQYTLLHELGHQIGLIDEYQMSFDGNDKAKNKVNGWTYSVASGLMNSVSPWLSAHSAGGLQAHLSKRRGYFGEYLFDVPKTLVVQAIDSEGKTLAGTRLQFFQRVTGGRIAAEPTFTLTTNQEGLATLPNRAARPFATQTGHAVHPNPFGQIDIGGGNGLFLVEASQQGRRVFGWLSLVQANLAHWSGLGSSNPLCVQFLRAPYDLHVPERISIGSRPVEVAVTCPEAQISVKSRVVMGGDWLRVSQSSQSTPSTLVVEVVPDRLPKAGAFGVIDVYSPSTGRPSSLLFVDPYLDQQGRDMKGEPQGPNLLSREGWCVKHWNQAKVAVATPEAGAMDVTIVKNNDDVGAISLYRCTGPLQDGSVYEVALDAKSSDRQRVYLTPRPHFTPWQSSGSGAELSLENQWRTYRHRFIYRTEWFDTRAPIQAITLELGNKKGTISVRGAEVRLVRGRP